MRTWAPIVSSSIQKDEALALGNRGTFFIFLFHSPFQYNIHHSEGVFLVLP